MSHVLLTVHKNEQSPFKHAIHYFLLIKVFVNTALWFFTTSVCLQHKAASQSNYIPDLSFGELTKFLDTINVKPETVFSKS